jgi:hypothetical protein
MEPTPPPPSANVPAPGKQNDRVQEWSANPTGAFSGIDYSQKGAAEGLDPYFVWADISGFAHLRKPEQEPKDMSHVPQQLPVLIALQEGVTPLQLLQALQPLKVQTNLDNADGPVVGIPSAYQLDQSQVPGGVLPAVVNRAFFTQRVDAALADFVRRIEIDLPQDAKLKIKPLDKDPKPVKRPPLQGKIIALIDDGCAFAHPHFSGRVKRLWDMNVRGPLSTVGPPAAFPNAAETYPGEYGRDLSDAELNQMVLARTYGGRVDEDAVYADFAKGTQGNVNRLQARRAHGTHVMDLACGPYFVQDTMCTREGGAEPANPTWTIAQTYPTQGGGQNVSDAQIIFVQLPMRTVQDTSGRNTMSTDVANALTYIVSQCDDDAQIVVNLSWGALAGPHDGGGTLEQAMDALIASQRSLHPMVLPKNRLQIVTPAGNGYQSRTHANFILAHEESQVMQWRTEPDDATESYVEIWIPTDLQVEVTVADPNGVTFPVVKFGDVRQFVGYHDPNILAGSILGVCYNDALLNGQNGHCVLLALAPTVSPDNTRATAPHGVWTLQVTNKSDCEGVVDAYIERDDVALGTRRGARQSYFEDPHYDRQALDDDVQVDPECPTPHAAYVRREGVFNNIATGLRTVKTGGVRETDLVIAEYSPHDFFSGRGKRAGTKTPVPFYATTEESNTLHGVRAAGTRAASTVRLSGTSMAGPQIARDLFNALP